MRKMTIPAVVGLCLFCFWATAEPAGTAMSIKVKTTQLRAEPSFFGKNVRNLVYGEQVRVLEESSSWAKVRHESSGAVGWINKSVLQSGKIEIKSGAAKVGHSATSDEVSLAGKAFKETETSYKKSNPALDYRWVDKMETFSVSEAEKKRFLKQGRISVEGGL